MPATDTTVMAVEDINSRGPLMYLAAAPAASVVASQVPPRPSHKCEALPTK